MSAIAGIYGYIGKDQIFRNGSLILDAMAEQPADQEMIWFDGDVFFGSRDQWITPESVGRANPLYDEKRRFAIVSDAIIDNRAQLLSSLGEDRARWSEISDQQLIVLAYAKWGKDVACRLIGDFAFVIWDSHSNSLYGARDFSGGRMLYYSWDEKQFSFCSMMEPLLRLPSNAITLNEQWLAQYLAITTVVDVASTDQTVYNDIRQLPPAHYFVLEKGRLLFNRYHNLEHIEPLKLKSNEEYVEAFREVFQEAVAAKLRTHLGIGAQLSGGLDSGAVVGFAARWLRADNRRLHTFSYVPVSDFIDYTSKRHMANEQPYIDKTVRHIGDIQPHYFDFRSHDSYSDINDMLHVMEMPYKFYTNSFWLKGMFHEASKRSIGILLNGGRGNLSISWGDPIPFYARLLKQMKWFKLMKELRMRSYTIGSGRKELLTTAGKEAFPLLRRWGGGQGASPFYSMINPAFAKRTRVFDQLREYGIGESGWLASGDAYKDRENHFQELFHWNASNTLAAKLSCRYKLWKRDPTNDLRVIRFCLSLPEEQYVQQGMSRALIRRATAQILPDSVRLNETVRGIQGADWLHRLLPRWDVIMDELRQLSRDSLLLELVDGRMVEETLKELQGGVRSEDAYTKPVNAAMYLIILHRFLQKSA